MGFLRKKNQRGAVPAEYSPGEDRKRIKGWRRPWIFWGIGVSFACAAVFSCFYGVFRSSAEKYIENPLERAENISWLYQSCYLLYRDLYNVRQGEQLGYGDIFLETDEGHRWLLEESKLTGYRQLLEVLVDQGQWDIDGPSPGFHEEEEAPEVPESSEEMVQTAGGGRSEIQGEALGQEGLAALGLKEEWLQEAVAKGNLDEEWLREYAAGGGTDQYDLTFEECVKVEEGLQSLRNYFQSLENSFSHLNSSYDYIIQDNTTERYLTNMSAEERERGLEEQHFLLSFTFDSMGNVTLGEDICGTDQSTVRRHAGEALRENILGSIVDVWEELGSYVSVKGPVDCTVTFAISNEAWASKIGRAHV